MPGAPRFHCVEPLRTGTTIELSAGAVRHAQVLRLQPGDAIMLFGGLLTGLPPLPAHDQRHTQGGEYEATITRMGRTAVQALIGRHDPVEREPARRLHLAIGMPANERMDWLVEKATELGASSIQPLMTERSVVRLDAERARKKTAHWISIAIAACEQCGRNTVPLVHAVRTMAAWHALPGPAGAVDAGARVLLSLRSDAVLLRAAMATVTLAQSITLLSGPEGGLGMAEEALAIDRGFAPVSLGPRVLRAETAVLAALTLLA